MAYFEWSPKLATGIETIDAQHQKLIAYVNQLNDAMSAGKGREAVGTVLKQLLEYTTSHFSLEEKAFERYAYPKRQEHVAAHEALRQKLTVFVARYQNNELALSIEMLRFLTEWVRDHIMKEDMQYVPFLKDKSL